MTALALVRWIAELAKLQEISEQMSKVRDKRPCRRYSSPNPPFVLITLSTPVWSFGFQHHISLMANWICQELVVVASVSGLVLGTCPAYRDDPFLLSSRVDLRINFCSTQKINLRPSWMTRFAPDPNTGSPAAWSAVSLAAPNVLLAAEGSLFAR